MSEIAWDTIQLLMICFTIIFVYVLKRFFDERKMFINKNKTDNEEKQHE